MEQGNGLGLYAIVWSRLRVFVQKLNCNALAEVVTVIIVFLSYSD